MSHWPTDGTDACTVVLGSHESKKRRVPGHFRAQRGIHMASCHDWRFIPGRFRDQWGGDPYGNMSIIGVFIPGRESRSNGGVYEQGTHAVFIIFLP